MKIYTSFTSSHKLFFDKYFLPSYKKQNKNKDFSLYVSEMDQISKNGSYYTYGFKQSTTDKIKVIIKAIEDNMGERIIYSDPDIQFFKGFKDDILKYKDLDPDVDVFCQCDTPNCPDNVTLCTGFMVLTCSEKLKNIFQNALFHIDMFEHDQYAFNYFGIPTLNWRTFPEDKYYTIAYNTGNVVWNGEEYNNIPRSILMHHANWTVGVENKIKLLKYIKRELSRKVTT